MSQELVVRLWCDVHGRGMEAACTVRLGLDRVEREVDLCSDCLDNLTAEIGPLLKAGRVPVGTTLPSHPERRRTAAVDSKMSQARLRKKLIRAWGDEHGEELGHPEWVGILPGRYHPHELERAWEAAVSAA